MSLTMIHRLQPDCDILAEKLMHLGRLGRSMPPSWDGARMSVPVLGKGGEYLGRVLPGKGVYIDADLRHVSGISKTLPNVYERTLVHRMMDIFHQNDRLAIKAASAIIAACLFPKAALPFIFGAISTYDGIISARAGGNANDVTVSKLSTTTTATNQWYSMFQSGGLPAAGTYTNIPGGAALNSTSTGAWSFGILDPTGGTSKYLLTSGFTSQTQINLAILVDLLVAAGNISATTATLQTVNSTALTRYTTGAGVMITFDVTTLLGNTASNITVTYTNQAGTGSRSSGAIAMTTAAIAQRLLPIAMGPYTQLQSGDYGVKSVESVQLSASMVSTGVFALNMYFPLAFMPGMAANVYVERDQTIQVDGLNLLPLDAGHVGCLVAFIMPNASPSGPMTWFMRTVQG